MKKTLYCLMAACGLALAQPTLAQDHSSHSTHGVAAPAANGSDSVMTTGEVTRVDARNGKLTIRHEEIKNLDMPPMTMVFSLLNTQQTTGFKPGDKVKFHAEEHDGALTITRIEAIK